MLAYFERKPRATINDHRVFQAAARLLPKLARQEYAEIEDYLDKVRDDHRERLVQGLAASEGAIVLATNWTRARPESPHAHVVLGASHVSQGWDLRGWDYVVDPALLPAIRKHLKAAEEPLHTAARLDRMRPDAFAWLIPAELGGRNDRATVASLFRAAVARAPLSWAAHHRYFLAITEKWGGSHQAMFGFVRDAAARAPRGSMIHSLLAMAFCEFVLAEGLEGQRRIRRPGCAQEVAGALYAWLDATPANLSEKLLEAEGGFAGTALNHFAVACYLCGARNEARALVAALHEEIETTPWRWIANGARESSDPAYVYDRVQRELERG
jgi:hypothetical protein